MRHTMRSPVLWLQPDSQLQGLKSPYNQSTVGKPRWGESHRNQQWVVARLKGRQEPDNVQSAGRSAPQALQTIEVIITHHAET